MPPARIRGPGAADMTCTIYADDPTTLLLRCWLILRVAVNCCMCMQRHAAVKIRVQEVCLTACMHASSFAASSGMCSGMMNSSVAVGDTCEHTATLHLVCHHCEKSKRPTSASVILMPGVQHQALLESTDHERPSATCLQHHRQVMRRHTDLRPIATSPPASSQ
jgi:hypothetical protein